MSQAYGDLFAKVYNEKCAAFAKQLAPRILDFYSNKPISETNKKILDLCCGTGQLAFFFLENEYKVVGIDLSESILHYAKENAKEYINKGMAKFIKGDAASFNLEEKFGLIVLTFDALNHLDGEESLYSCFKSVLSVVIDGGYFVFDLNTQLGLQRWNSISINESDEITIINRGIFDKENSRALTKISGFINNGEGLYQRYDEVVYNIAYDMDRVKDMLLDIGWKDIYFARSNDLLTSIEEPEKEGRVFIIAKKE